MLNVDIAGIQSLRVNTYATATRVSETRTECVMDELGRAVVTKNPPVEAVIFISKNKKKERKTRHSGSSFKLSSMMKSILESKSLRHPL